MIGPVLKTKLGVKYYRNLYQKRPVAVNLEVTKRCNARCDFCDYWKTKQEDAISDYGPVVKKIDPMHCTFTGGEPLLRPDLVNLVKGVRTAVPTCYLAMITNASLLTVEKARELRNAGINQISISVDYLDDRHDQSRGVPGLWKRIEGLLPELAKIGFDAVNFNWIIMEQNFDQILDVARYARDHGTHVSYTSYSDLKNSNDGHFLSPENMKLLPQKIEEIKEFKKKYGTVRSSNYYLDRIPVFYGKKEIQDCPAGMRWIQITPEGWFKPCSELPPVVHWKDYDVKNSFKKQECTLCWYGCRGENQTPIDLQRIGEFL